MRPVTAGALTTAALLTVYALTLAPGLTFWDAGELIAAVETLGIPHPPGTPLWVLIARAWSDLLGFLPRALATNLLSAVAVSAATGILAMLIVRWSGRAIAGIAAGVCAGTMSTVWLNATETETYALALLLGALMLLAGERAGVTHELRWKVLLAYLIVLAVPLHLSALVAAPAAIALAVKGGDGAIHWRTGSLLGAVLFATAALGTVTAGPLVLAAVLLIAAVAADPIPRRAMIIVGVAAVAVSALLFLPLRAAHDPWLNSQNPVEWSALWELVGRRQYGDHPLWPRRAPAWAQLGMLAQYADWQVALGLTPGIVPSPQRVLASLLFVGLGIAGAMWHRTLHRRSFLATLVLLVCGTLGLVAYMNFRPGPTFGHGLLPAGTLHEARERDYFFLFGFWTWGAWAGMGAVRATMRLPRGLSLAGLLLPALPLLLNWRAVDRSREPEASLPMLSAHALLASVPERAVLVTYGDNDGYPAWYAQAVAGVRGDVTVIISPMLNARWYREELSRRHGLIAAEVVRQPGFGERGALPEVARRAAEQGRPLVVASTIDRHRRHAIASAWTLAGLWLRPGTGDVYLPALAAFADTMALRSAVETVAVPPAAALRGSTDPTERLVRAWMDCPRAALALARGALPADSLATVCKL